MMGSEETITTRANFQWKTLAIVTHPIRLKMEMSTMAILIPRSCCSCAGSVAIRAVKSVDELSESSKKEILLVMMLWKYSSR
jgi:hypothetical protein